VPSPERIPFIRQSGTHLLLGPEATHSHAPLSRYGSTRSDSFFLNTVGIQLTEKVWIGADSLMRYVPDLF
jgi:hypothetical protein